jgi:hypothetical protein
MRIVMPTLFWAAAMVVALPLAAAPRVDLATTELDFGKVRQGDPVAANVSIGNSGTEALVIERMEFTVPGMTARLKQTIDPGDSAVVELKWDTERLRGAVEGRLSLYLNDPAVPRVDIDLHGEVMPAIEFVPRPALYLSQFAGETQSGSIILKSNQDEPLQIEGLRASSDRFESRIETIEPDRSFKLVVSTRPDLKPGRYRDQLWIATSDSGHPELHIEVNILVKPDLFVTPDAVDFGTISRSHLIGRPEALGLLRQSVVIRRRQGTMRVTSASADLSALDLTISPDGSAEGFLLEVGMRPEKLEAGSVLGSIRIETDDPAHPELTIPVRGEVSD